MSSGARNCPFLMLTTLPVRAAATSRSVWRDRNAGICRTSATSAAAAGLRGLVDVGEDRQAGARLDVGERAQARRRGPGRGTTCRDVRLALSNEALKMTGTPQRAAISLMRERQYRARAPGSR